MGIYTRIPESTFTEMQLDAGIVLTKFDPTGVTAVEDADIICATTGGITVSCVPTYSDLGEDVDNCPVNVNCVCGILQEVCRIVDIGKISPSIIA